VKFQADAKDLVDTKDLIDAKDLAISKHGRPVQAAGKV
jgi:hypothetical protein